MGVSRLILIAAGIAAGAFGATVAIYVWGGWRPQLDDAARPDYGPAKLRIEPVQYTDLPGWRSDDLVEAVAVFERSCVRFDALADDARVNAAEAQDDVFGEASLAGLARDWRQPCAAARAFATGHYTDDAAKAATARVFFELHFRPFRALAAARPLAEEGPEEISRKGLFTGYFEPAYEASTFKSAQFTAPLYARPSDLVMVDLGQFRKDFAGERIAGFVDGGALRPYPDHREINAGALDGRAQVLAWLEPNDLLFLQIQGSGRLRFRSGGAIREIRVGYDGANGRPYTPVGRVLIEEGEIPREKVSMQSIRAWLDAAAPERAAALREENESYVFFRELDALPRPELGPLGAQGVQLTASRSLAVDRRFHALGAPVWVSIDAVEGRTPDIRRLFIAQDTGGAIKGPIRGDIFIGFGPRAGEAAGKLAADGEMYVLLPNAVADRLDTAGLVGRP